jgi:hypothetical protein
MKMARIPAKLKVSKMDQYCSKIAIFFVRLVKVISVCVPHSTSCDNCMTFGLWSSGLQRRVVTVGV